ncbi:MAG TPA: hypothetical protein VF660_05165 [Actinomycetota bacterium]
MIPCAYLRVFRPLETFPAEERDHWERYIIDGGPPPPHRPVYRHESSRRDQRVGLLAPAEGEHADIRLVGGEYYVCPWRTRLRILAGILSLRDSGPAEMVGTLLPETEIRRAARELAKLKRREPSAAAPSMLQSPWHVPVRWFILVDEDERRLVEQDGGYRLYYWTPIAKARKRADVAIQTIRRSELAPIAQLVTELAEWLSHFDQRSVVELDYASVSSLFSWDELDDDHSGREIQESIQALGSTGGLPRAAELYQMVSNRWADAMSRESLN